MLVVGRWREGQSSLITVPGTVTIVHGAQLTQSLITLSPGAVQVPLPGHSRGGCSPAPGGPRAALVSGRSTHPRSLPSASKSTSALHSVPWNPTSQTSQHQVGLKISWDRGLPILQQNNLGWQCQPAAEANPCAKAPHHFSC